MKQQRREGSFGAFFEEPLYLRYKNHLYNYLCRRWVVRRAVGKARDGWTLELGCGVSPMLAPHEGVVQMDISWRGLKFLAERRLKGMHPVACDGTQLPFRDAAFRRIICSEVLEHIEADEQALEEMSRTLKKGGELFLTCPIHLERFGFDDEFVGHYRRYEVAALTRTLKQKGLEIVETSPVLGSLEKKIMEPVTRLFAHHRQNRASPERAGGILFGIAWLAFPLYLALNYFLAFCVYLQAQWASPAGVVNLGIRCRKIR